MTVKVKTSAKALVDAAMAEIETVSVEQAMRLHEQDDVVMVDLRDVREVQREGRIPGSFHMPRGMLEFWIDPASPYFKDIFDEDKRFVFHCNKGWRSALATQAAARIGLERVCHFEGGFTAWKAAGGPVETVHRR